MRLQVLVAAAMVFGGVALSGCEREERREGVEFEVEVDPPREEERPLDRVGEDVERGIERTGEEVERGVERTGEELDRAGERLRDERRD